LCFFMNWIRWKEEILKTTFGEILLRLKYFHLKISFSPIDIGCNFCCNKNDLERFSMKCSISINVVQFPYRKKLSINFIWRGKWVKI
jgi:hypothetical protein